MPCGELSRHNRPMASAASVRTEMIAGEFAGEGAPLAIVRAVGGRREEEAGFRPTRFPKLTSDWHHRNK